MKWIELAEVPDSVSAFTFTCTTKVELEIHSNIMLLLWNNGRKNKSEDYPTRQFMVGLLMCHGFVDTALATIFPLSVRAGFVKTNEYLKFHSCFASVHTIFLANYSSHKKVPMFWNAGSWKIQPALRETKNLLV